MGYNKDNLEELMSTESLTTKQKLAELLRIDCKMYTNLGTDSTVKESNTVKLFSKKIYKYVKKLNPIMGINFLNAMDSK
tara:strand:- start:362 stop:598 length:237 start_codon:yes stop_codon:yes gene_type:complete